MGLGLSWEWAFVKIQGFRGLLRINQINGSKMRNLRVLEVDIGRLIHNIYIQINTLFAKKIMDESKPRLQRLD